MTIDLKLFVILEVGIWWFIISIWMAGFAWEKSNGLEVSRITLFSIHFSIFLQSPSEVICFPVLMDHSISPQSWMS
jgi:hypothetical protein